MKVTHVYFNSYQRGETPDQLLRRLFTIKDWVDILSKKGVAVTVTLRFHQDLHWRVGMADYYFIRDGRPAWVGNRQVPVRYLRRLLRLLVAQVPHVLHAHDLNTVTANALLRQVLPRQTPMLIQDHGALPQSQLLQLQRFFFRQVDAFLFAAPGQEISWLAHGVIPAANRCFFIMENSVDFQINNRALSRTRTGLFGDPVFLWVGNLNANKDPLTVLYGMEPVFAQLPGARMYLLYKEADLEQVVLSWLAARPSLTSRIHLLGERPRAELAAYYNSANYFLLGSHKEGSGYALIEALACGCIPVVTDIPSFRRLTNGGRLGGLWTPGCADSLTDALQVVLKKDQVAERQRVRRYFEQQWSFEALGNQMLGMYEQIHKLKGKT